MWLLRWIISKLKECKKTSNFIFCTDWNRKLAKTFLILFLCVKMLFEWTNKNLSDYVSSWNIKLKLNTF